MYTYASENLFCTSSSPVMDPFIPSRWQPSMNVMTYGVGSVCAPRAHLRLLYAHGRPTARLSSPKPGSHAGMRAVQLHFTVYKGRVDCTHAVRWQQGLSALVQVLAQHGFGRFLSHTTQGSVPWRLRVFVVRCLLLHTPTVLLSLFVLIVLLDETLSYTRMPTVLYQTHTSPMPKSTLRRYKIELDEVEDT